MTVWARVCGFRLPAILALAVLLGVPGSASAADPSPDGTTAMFEGVPIDLAEGWGEAHACVVWEAAGIVECFRTEAAMDARVSELQSEGAVSAQRGFSSLSTSCSSYLRLYEWTYYSGDVLYILDRGVVINLSSYGFGNRTSSFKVGACASYFYDYPNLGGALYPTSYTEAWDQSNFMLSGWNDRVSSVILG